MIPKTKLSFLLAAAAIVTSASCSTAQGESEAHVQTAKVDHIETVKPGASISLTTSKASNMTAGQFAPVSLSFEENYDDGEMLIEVTASNGLRIFGNESRKTFQMSGASNHVWPLDVSAAEDGIYFVSILASALDSANNVSSQRSFSVRLDVGNITPAMKSQAFPENGTLSSDGSLRILEAQETIQ